MNKKVCLRRVRKNGLKFLLALALLLLLAQTAFAFSSLVGSEFIIYPTTTYLNGNPDDINDVYTDRVDSHSYSEVAIVALYDNTSIEVRILDAYGINHTIYDSTTDYPDGIKKGQALDFYHDLLYNGEYPAAKFIHILSSEPVYVFVAQSGALRQPPGADGTFLSDSYAIHWANEWNAGTTVAGSANEYVMILTNKPNVTVTVTPYDGTTGLPVAAGVPCAPDCTFTFSGDMTNAGLWTHLLDFTSTTSIPDSDAGAVTRPTLTYLIEATDEIHVEQYLGHIDTMNWIGSIDEGLLVGNKYYFPTDNYGEGTATPTGAFVFNPNDVPLTVSRNYITGVTSSSNQQVNYTSVTGVSSCTVPAHSYRSCSFDIGAAGRIAMLNGSADFYLIAGISEAPTSQDLTTHPFSLDDYGHIYTRIPPVDYFDRWFYTPAGMRAPNSGSIHYQGGAGYVWYSTVCRGGEPTNIVFDETHTFRITYDDIYETVNPLQMQGINSMVTFGKSSNDVSFNFRGYFNASYCTLINATNSTGGTGCSDGDMFTVSAGNSSFAINFTGWIAFGAASSDTAHYIFVKNISLGDGGLLHMSGTDGVTGTGDSPDVGTTFNNMINFTSDRPVAFYRISTSACSNSPVESTSPLVKVGINVDKPEMKWGEENVINVSTENEGSKEASETFLIHNVPYELKPYLAPYYFKVWFDNINGTEYDISYNITFVQVSSPEECKSVSTDIHKIIPGDPAYNSSSFPAVACVQYVDVPGAPYDKTVITFNLGTFRGLGDTGIAERLHYSYTAYARYKPPTGQLDVVEPDVKAEYLYCSPWFEQQRNASARANTSISVSNLVLIKTLAAEKVPYADGTNVTILIEFGDLSTNLMKNVTVVDYFAGAVNFTYIGTPTNESGPYSTFRSFNGSSLNQSYVNKTDINISDWGYTIGVVNGTDYSNGSSVDFGRNYSGNLSFKYNYTDTVYLQNPGQGALMKIEIPLRSNGTNPENLSNCVDVFYTSFKNETSPSGEDGYMHTCFEFTQAANSSVNKVMDKHNFTVGETGISNVTWSTYPEFSVSDTNGIWQFWTFCDDLPVFLDYTGYANLTTTNPDGSYSATYGIGSNNWEGGSNISQIITNGWWLERMSSENNSEYYAVDEGGKLKRRVCWRLVYQDGMTDGNMTDWTLSMGVIATDPYNYTGTAVNYTLNDRNYGHIEAVHFGKEIALTSTPWEVFLYFQPGFRLNKTITNLTRNYENTTSEDYAGGPVEPGDYVYYSILFRYPVAGNYNFTSHLYNLTMWDTIPANTTLVNWTSGTDEVSPGGVVTYGVVDGAHYWNLTNLSNNANWTINFTIYVHSNASVIENNTANVRIYDSYNNSLLVLSETTPQVPVIHPDLDIFKYINDSGLWVVETMAEPGEYIDFIIVFSNPSQAHAYNVTFRDMLPPWFSYVPNSSYILNYSGSDIPIGDGNLTYNPADISTGINITWDLSWYSGLVYFGPSNFTDFKNYTNVLEPGENITIKFRANLTSNVTDGLNTNRACTNGTDRPGESPWGIIPEECAYAQVVFDHPRMTLDKTGNATQAHIGDVVEYTVVISNVANATAYDVTISDDLQEGFELIGMGILTLWDDTVVPITTVEESPPAGSLIHWNYTVDIPAWKSITLKYNTSVTSDARCGINVVTVNYADGYGTILPYLQDIWEVCPIIRGELSIDKMSIDSIAYPGSNVTYEIVISNSGTDYLYNITLNDTLPDVPGDWTYVNNSIINLTNSTCNVTYNGTHFIVAGNLSPGAVCRFRYDAETPELTCFGEYYNFIDVSAYDVSGAQFNASSYDSTDVVPDVILDVSKSVNISANNGSLVYEYGSVIEFIINVTSRGNTTVYNVTLNDDLAHGLEFVNCTNESGSLVTVSTAGSAAVGQSINFSAGNITGGSYKVFYARANITSAAFEGTNINKIIVSGEGPCGPVITDFDIAAFAIGVPKLDVHKTADGGSIEPGGQMTYHVRVKNTGTGTAYNVNVTDILTGLKYVPNSSYLNDTLVGDPVNLSNKLIWNSTNLTVNLTSGSEIILTFNLTTDLSADNCAVDMAIDEAYANASDGYGNIVSDTQSVQTDVIHPFITVTKFANVTKAEAGDLIKYTITVRNPSRATAYNVTVTDVLQAGFVNQSGGDSPVSYNDTTRTLTWAPFNLSGNNATIIISYNAMATPNASAPPGINLVSVSAVDGGGCVLVNATDAWGVIIFHPAVQVRKNVNVPEAQPGSVLEYSVSVFNPSEARAYNVSVYEFSQPGFYNTSGTAAVYELRTSGIKEWLTYLGAISIRNASVNKTGTNVSALYFDLSNISSVTGSAIRNGSLASYAGLTIKFNMTAGANAVTGSDEAWAQGNYYDGTFASMDYDTEHVVVNYPYLIIEKFIMPHTLATASPGDTVAYSIRIINPNSGKADALIWSIIDELQYGHSITSNGTGTLTYANGTNSSYNFTFNSTTGSVNFIPTDWTGNFSIKLSPGGELILNFTTYVDSSAELYGCDKASYNATDLMNTSITQTYAEKCLSILKPQVRITKVSNTTTAEPGSMVEFTLILENRGSSAVYNVTVNDVMSAGWEFIAATQNITGMNDTESNSPGSSSNNTVLFGNITLNAGDKKTIKYAALVTDNASGGLNVNCANITGYGGSNANYTDGYCINVMVYLPALEIVKDVSQHDVEPGSEPLVTIIIENPTYATVYNVTITDFLPRGFNYTAGSAKLNGRTIDDPVISGNQSDFACDWSACDAPGAGTGNGLNVTWRWNETNFTDAAGGLALDNIPAKTIMVLTFKSHVKCSVCNDTFNNTVNVSGVTGAGGAVGPESTFFEMKGYLADAEIYKYASNNAPTYFEYVDYKIVIWNNPVGANIAPLTLADIMPPYLRYVPGYAYVGDLKLEPAVCGDYTDKTTNDTITNVRNDSSGVNCTGFNGTLMDAAGTKFNATESQGDGKGQILLWNLSKWLFLTPGQQVTVKYRTTIIPGIAGTARNNVTLSYLDPEHPDLCLDCEFDMSTSAVIAVNSPPGFVPDDVNYTLNLNRGWNLISVPIRPYDTSLSSVLAPVEGRYLDVASWDSQWVYRSYAYGDWFGSLSTIEPGKGYWLNMREPASLTVSGETITEFNLTLHGGWNLIGWPSLEPVPLNNLSVDYVDAATWDSQWIYRSYAYGDWFGSLSSLEPGKGYWLNVKENAVIQNIPQESGSGGS